MTETTYLPVLAAGTLTISCTCNVRTGAGIYEFVKIHFTIVV